MNENGCLRDLLDVKEAIDDAIHEYIENGIIPHDICNRLRKSALHLFAEWENASDETTE